MPSTDGIYNVNPILALWNMWKCRIKYQLVQPKMIRPKAVFWELPTSMAPPWVIRERPEEKALLDQILVLLWQVLLSFLVLKLTWKLKRLHWRPDCLFAYCKVGHQSS
ncbi:hypothetical protein ACH5RR_023395 [Cinchona calisaya]|uniref:Uncharacterized protein n=1 Tax=Cinchona calisaya TaxID=153742 RepID=A0ABD2ZAK7_9GENT